MKQAKVLLVADDLVSAKSLVKSLASWGYPVVAWVTSGEAALVYLTRHLPDLALVDLDLQGKLNSIETVKQMQSQYGIPSVYLARSPYSELCEEVKNSSCHYLTQPFKKEDIQTVIEVSLNQYYQHKDDQALTQAQNDYISMISHEFRTPLTAIQMATKILQEYEDNLSRDRKEHYFRQINGAIRNLDAIIEDFLVMSHAESGKLPVEPCLVDLREFCQKLLTTYQCVNRDRHNLVLDIDLDCQQVFLDERRLRYILNNLLTNALKYSPDGGEIRLEVTHPGNYIQFIISDRGIGIPPEYQPKLFKRFERARNVGKIRGTGLGLSIVKQVVEEQGGLIKVESQVGKGTTVKVLIPEPPRVAI